MVDQTVNWRDYEPYDVVYGRPYRELTRKEALASFNRYIASHQERLRVLHGLLNRNGIEVEGITRDGLATIDSWYRSTVKLGPDGEFLAYWNGVSHDIGRYFGECLCLSYPWLKWELLTRPPSGFSYQRPVVVGFTRAGYQFVGDPDHVVQMNGHLYGARPDGQDTGGTVLSTYDTWAAFA